MCINPCLIQAKNYESHIKVFYDIRYSQQSINQSIFKNIPTFEKHTEWYIKQDMKKMFLVWDKQYIGYLRISLDNYISIAIKENEYNKGYATFLLSNIVKRFNMLKAEIYNDNIKSIKLFEKFPCISINYIDGDV